MIAFNLANPFIEIENAIKTLLYKISPELLKALDFDNSDCFI